MIKPIYIDNHSTTRVDPRVLEKFVDWTESFYGNAGSLHEMGMASQELVERARRQVAELACCEPGEVVFTSCATESINWVLKGLVRLKPLAQLHIVTCETEHSAVLETCRFLESQGARITRLPVQNDGTLSLSTLELTLKSGPDLLTLAHANNEIGTIHPVSIIGNLCRQNKVLFHVDAAQTLGKIPVNFQDSNIDFLSASAHKLYAPKGTGLLVTRRSNPPLRLFPLLHGGGQERGLRSGTLNVPGIAAFGLACEICNDELEDDANRIGMLRNRLWSNLKDIPGIHLNGTMEGRLPGNLNVSFRGIPGQQLLPSLRADLCVSSGSACAANRSKPSYVLQALGLPDDLAQASLRFGIGRFNTTEEMDFAGTIVTSLVKRLTEQN